MDSNTGQTFIEEMQPNFDALPERLKDEKFRNHLTNQQLSDVSGVPIATTSRILSGAVSNPRLKRQKALVYNDFSKSVSNGVSNLRFFIRI